MLPEYGRAAITAAQLRNGLVEHGAVLLRAAADPGFLVEVKDRVEAILTHYAQTDQTDEQIALSHVYEPVFRAAAGFSYLDILRRSGLWWLLRRAFPEAELRPSPVVGSRRISSTELRRFWDTPIEWHVDAAVHYDHCLTVNFWTPLDPCGRDAPGLGVVPISVAATKDYLAYDPVGYTPGEHDIALMHKFLMSRARPQAIAAAGLVTEMPEMVLGDMLAFTNFTLHGTHYDPAMTKPRTSVELRVDLIGAEIGR